VFAAKKRGRAAMIDFYCLTSPNVQKIFIMLEELELPYRQIQVDVWKSEQYAPEFAKINPNCKIPVIVDHDGPGGKPYTVFESGAILMYLADKHTRFLPREPRALYDTLQWLMIQLTNIGPMFGQWTHFKLFAPPGSDYAMTRYQSELLRLYDVLETRLGHSSYLGGSEYTIADIATFPWIRQHDAQGASFDKYPNVKRWFETIAERPAVKRALEKVAAIKSNRDNASDDQKDRFFNRGRYTKVAGA
jgi:GSH-dependent disulfide-bond oxidoreductase